MDFTVWKAVCIGSLFALSVLVFLLWWCRTDEAKQMERVVEHADGGDTMREDTLHPRHKVFLSHSGAQKNFVEQLCVDLERCDRYPFFDKRWYSLPIGRNFPRLIFEAIEQCEVGVVVLSEEFFTLSKWPMLELVAMTRNPKLVIIPVFLGISLEQFRDPKHQKRWLSIWRGWAQKDKRVDIEGWRGALKALGPLNSLVYDRASEVSFREKIVKAVCDTVLPQTRWEDSHVQGRSRLSKVIGEKINQAKVSKKYGVPLVGLYGVGGIGKTTICQTLCNEYSTKVQGRVFHAELGSASGLELLQGALKSLTNKSHDVLCGLNMSQCHDLLKREMRQQAIFLAIDNMSDNTKSIEQAKIFLTAGFCDKSVVVITARSLEVLKLCHLDIDETSCLEMPELHEDEAKALFMEHAVCDEEARAEVDDEIIDSCLKRCYFQKGDGKSYHYHPLALKVLGIQLGCTKYDRHNWATGLEELDTFNSRREEEHPIFSILRKSFDILLPTDRMLFMDVALFLPELVISEYYIRFNVTWFEWLSTVHGTSVHDVMERLEGLKRKSLLQDLGDGRSTKIGMHDLWREFAVKESEVGEFEGRRWVYEVGELSALGEGTPSGGYWQNMKRMCFLGNGLMIVNRINFDHFPNIIVMKLVSGINLRVGVMLDVNNLKHLKSLEVVLYDKVEVVGLASLENIRFLHLRRAQISGAEIDDIGHLTNLRVLILTDLEGEKLPDISKLITLEEVQFSGCSQVAAVSGLSSGLSNLRVLNLSYCSELRSLGPGVGDLVALQELLLYSCMNLNELPNLLKLIELRRLHIGGCSRIKSVAGLDDLVALEDLFVGDCRDIAELPNLQKLTKLWRLNIRGCSRIESVAGLDDLVALEELWVGSCRDIAELPNLQKLTKLWRLWIRGCSRIKSVAGLDDLVALEELWAGDCRDIAELPNLQKLTELRTLDIGGCSRIKSVAGLDDLVALEQLWAGDCRDIAELPNLQKLTKLRILHIGGCWRIKSVAGLDDLVSLEELWAGDCRDIAEFPNLQKLTELRKLDIGGCCRIKSVPGLDDLVALEQLWARNCSAIAELPCMSKLTKLQVLDLRECPLESAPGMGDLINLQELSAHVKQLPHQPDLQWFSLLRKLDITGCSSPEFMRGVLSLSMLESLTVMDCTLVDEVPDLQNLRRLKDLVIGNCEFKDVSGLSGSTALEKLCINGCGWVERLPDMHKLMGLRWLEMRKCDMLRDLLGMRSLSQLETLKCEDLPLLREVPDLSNFPLLKELNLIGCDALVRLMSTGPLGALEVQGISGCRNLNGIPDLTNFSQLKVLRLSGCESLMELPFTGPSVSLEELDLSGCKSLATMPDLSKFSRLKVLRLSGCESLMDVTCTGPSALLVELDLSGCKSLIRMPDLSNFLQLKALWLRGCDSLMELTSRGCKLECFRDLWCGA